MPGIAQQRLARRTPTLVLLGFLTLVTACSQVKVAYGFLDWYMIWKVDRLVELNDAQRARTKQAIAEFHTWHRRTQLPRYADYLQGLEKRLIPGKITAQMLHAETDHVQLLLDDSLQHLMPSVTEVVASLSDRQVAELLKSVTEERDEYIEEHLAPPPERRRQNDREELTDYLKPWIGQLTDQQEQWVETWSQELKPYAEATATQHVLWQEHLEKYLALRDNKALLDKGLRALMLYRTDNWHEKAQTIMDANQALTYELLAKILNSLSDEQRAHLDRRFDHYITDFRELAAANK